LFETWLCRSKAGSRWGLASRRFVGGILCAIGWAINRGDLAQWLSRHDHRGHGAGGVYGTCVGNALKWFPTSAARRGITAAGWRRVSADGCADPGNDQIRLPDHLPISVWDKASSSSSSPSCCSRRKRTSPRRDHECERIQSRAPPADGGDPSADWLMYFMFVIGRRGMDGHGQPETDRS
jgi:hypothetical protein